MKTDRCAFLLFTSLDVLSRVRGAGARSALGVRPVASTVRLLQRSGSYRRREIGGAYPFRTGEIAMPVSGLCVVCGAAAARGHAFLLQTFSLLSSLLHVQLGTYRGWDRSLHACTCLSRLLVLISMRFSLVVICCACTKIPARPTYRMLPLHIFHMTKRVFLALGYIPLS